MRILILGGAGLMSTGTARDLLSKLSSGVERVVAADSSAERLAALKQSLNDPRLETRVFDVNDRAALMTLLADCDLCVNGVPTFAGFQLAIFEACLEAKRAYVDYGGMGVYTVRQKAEHAKWAKAGVTAVIGLGADPGMSNIICRAVADQLDRIDRINLYWAATKIGPESPVLVPPYSISTVLAEYANPSQQFLDGKLQEVPPQSGAETMDLPEPWGRTTFIHSQHSEPLTVPFSQGIAEKGIQEFTWKLSLPARDHEAWVGLVKAGFGAADEPVTVKGVTVKPLDVLQAVIGHPDPLYDDYVDAGTSMNMSIGVQQILNRPLRPGVWAAEEYFETEAFFAELRKRHFSIEMEMEPMENAA
jgi:saccharopine dehydrogenase-like NADP-dependent oxidoreductase